MSTCELLTREASGPVDAHFTKIVAGCYTGPQIFFYPFSFTFRLNLMNPFSPFFYIHMFLEEMKRK